MSKQPVAVVGVGQTKYSKKRGDVSMPGLVREAAQRALEQAGASWSDVEAVVIGKAPDIFEGVMQPELFLADALGAAGKPMIRVHTAGSVGGSTSIVGSHLVASGEHGLVLAVAWEKQSEGNAMFALGGGKSGSMGAGGIFAPWIKEYIRRSGAPEHIGWQVAVKDRQNALKNPYAHLKLKDISIESVKESPMLWDPLHFLESCPSSDGAIAMVFGNEQWAGRVAQPAWILSTSMRSELGQFPGRDTTFIQAASDCAKEVYEKAGITNPREQIDVAELYVPFSWYEPMWLENHHIAELGEGWKMTDSGETAMDGSFPVNPSGGVLSSNPIGASGMIRFGEAAMQVMGTAGEHQIDGARVALAQAYGGAAQYFAMWVVSSEQQPF
ncbi:MAG: Propanoyl-CoA C-acyltransferase [Actinomycetia bacterium]|nr:Propanoyl-CoA C-acyltransferase [Actinomycetes bacterium]